MTNGIFFWQNKNKIRRHIGSNKVLCDWYCAYVEGGGPIRRLCCHRVKTSLGTHPNRIHIVLNHGWYSVRCSIDHTQNQCVRLKITCNEGVLLLKTISFLHIQNGHNRVDTPFSLAYYTYLKSVKPVKIYIGNTYWRIH